MKINKFLYLLFVFPLLSYAVDLNYHFKHEDDHCYITTLKISIAISDPESNEAHDLKINAVSQLHYAIEKVVGNNEAIVRVKMTPLSVEVDFDEENEILELTPFEVIDYLSTKGLVKKSKIVATPFIKYDEESEVIMALLNHFLSQLSVVYPSKSLEYGHPHVVKQDLEILGFELKREDKFTLHQQNSESWMALQEGKWSFDPANQSKNSGCVGILCKEFSGEDASSYLISRKDGWPIGFFSRGYVKGLFCPSGSEIEDGVLVDVVFEYSQVESEIEEMF